MNTNNIHKGHRERIDRKSHMLGLEFLEEHEQLEKILFVAIPRGNTNEIAHRLLDKFGSLYGVLTADVDNLCDIEGIGRRTAEYISDLLPVLGIAQRCMMKKNDGVVLNTIEEVGEYTKTLFYGKVIENLYMISLNSANKVIRYDKISEGTVAVSEVPLHKISKLAVVSEASSVIIAHNHPGGKLEPSYADCLAAREIKENLSVLGIRVKANIIVSGGEWREISVI